MRINVVYLGPAKDWAGVEQEMIEVDDRTELDGLLSRLKECRPGLAAGRHTFRCAVNEAYAPRSTILSDGDEVAVIPPVSGGNDEDYVALVSTPIDAGGVRRHVESGGRAGGVVVFEGVVRAEEHPAHGALIRLEYEAHKEMAVKRLEALICDARRRWPIERVAVVHRLGPVECGETSVVVAVACVQRGEAFSACRWLIDELKKDVPIWKQEVWQDGETTWVEPTREGA